jgi:glutamate 5-kinase
VAALVQADYLFLMTDVDCLYTSNPKDDPNAKPIYEVEDISKLQADTSTKGTQWGTGGMATKLTAGRIATAAGTTMVICSSSDPESLVKVLNGERVGTRFHPRPHALRGRKRWILSVPVRGKVCMDDGAVRAVRDRKKSLFAAGIVNIEGDFHAQDAVSLCDLDGCEFGRGLVNFSIEELRRVKGVSAKDFLSKLGYNAQAEVVHRENLSLLAGPEEEDVEDDEEVPSPGPGLTPPNLSRTASPTICADTNGAPADILAQKLQVHATLQAQ